MVRPCAVEIPFIIIKYGHLGNQSRKGAKMTSPRGEAALCRACGRRHHAAPGERYRRDVFPLSGGHGQEAEGPVTGLPFPKRQKNAAARKNRTPSPSFPWQKHRRGCTTEAQPHSRPAGTLFMPSHSPSGCCPPFCMLRHASALVAASSLHGETSGRRVFSVTLPLILQKRSGVKT